jgi:signal transduction histidine kinase
MHTNRSYRTRRLMRLDPGSHAASASTPLGSAACDGDGVDRLRAIGQLASGLAHDLNQSLSLIAGYAELADHYLEQPMTDGSEVHNALQLIHEAALSAGLSLSRLLSYAGDAHPPAMQSIPLKPLLVEVSELTAVRWRYAARTTGRQIQVNIDADTHAIVNGCRTSLQQALVNLILNAVDALPDGGTINLRAWRQAQTVEMEVADSGIGMPPDVQARVFEPFFTTKDARGTGLGLAQVLRTIDEHDGSISIASAPGKGTSVRLSFPSTVREIDAG